MKKGEKVLLTVKPQLKLIGKLQDGNVFLKKGHDNEEDLFEFKTDEGRIIYLVLFSSV
ncbi:Peptidyl-prolyl cis-trans isomerase fkbp62 [Sarracenia purpurea var. burkii]